MKLVVQIALGVILAVVLLIAGCTALLSAGSSEAQSESDKTGGPLPPTTYTASSGESAKYQEARAYCGQDTVEEAAKRYVVESATASEVAHAWVEQMEEMFPGEAKDPEVKNAWYEGCRDGLLANS